MHFSDIQDQKKAPRRMEERRPALATTKSGGAYSWSNEYRSGTYGIRLNRKSISSSIPNSLTEF